jgi:hypothetical protein
MVTSIVLPMLATLMLLFGSASAGGMPEQPLPSHVKPCCGCGQCTSLCRCGCGCGLPSTGLMCLQRYDADKRIASFKGEHGKTFEVPVADPDILARIKPGECGRLTLTQVRMCTDFKPEQPSQSKP